MQRRLRLIRRRVTPLYDLLRTETGGFLPIAAQPRAVVWANSPFAASYVAMLGTYAAVGSGPFSVSLSLLHWGNDALMAMFFLPAGLGIKRELAVDALSSPRLAGAVLDPVPLGIAAGLVLGKQNGVFSGSLVCAVAGLAWLRLSTAVRPGKVMPGAA